jgi:two-component system, NtrC family, sensor histidine kinase KinB
VAITDYSTQQPFFNRSISPALTRDVTGLRNLERLRQEFTSLISHDLRNPLTAIRGHAQILQRNLSRQNLQAEAASADAIVRSASRMNSMIQDLAESSRLESGQLKLKRERTDLCALLLDIAGRVGSADDQARLAVECPENSPLASVDPERSSERSSTSSPTPSNTRRPVHR